MSDEEIYQQWFSGLQDLASVYGHSLCENDEQAGIEGRPYRLENRWGKIVYEGHIMGAVRYMADKLPIKKSERHRLKLITA